jgi:filamentous hemagglutinin
LVSFLVILAVLLINHINNSNKSKAVDSITSATSYAVTNLPLNNLSLSPGQTLSAQDNQISQVTLNGQLHLNDAAILTPIATPTGAVAGEVYYDKTTNQPYYYNGNQFISMSAPATVINSIDGLSGALQLGSGLQITNGQIALSQASPSSIVTNLQGTTNQVLLSGSTGSISLSLPQDISPTSSPTFAGLSLSSPLPVTSGGTNATNPITARSSLGAAASGVNSDITSLTNLSTISPSSSLRVGSNTQTLALQGSTTTLSDTANGYNSTLAFSVPTQNSTIVIPNSSGTICLQASTSCGFASSTNAFIQGGNSFGTTATIGTLDNNGLNLKTNGSTTESLSSSGTAVFKPTVNAVGSFQVQNAAGTSNLLIADTSNGRIGIGTATPQYTLDVAGDINIANNQAYRINGVVVCSNIGCAPSGGSNSYVQLQASTPGTAQSGSSNISGTSIAGSFTGSGLGLTNLDASQVATGTLNDLRLNANVTTQGNTFNGASQLVQTTSLSYLPGLNGSLVTNLNASNLTSGTVSDTRLSTNVPLLNATNSFTGANSFSTAITTPGIQTTSAGYAINLGFSGTATGAVTYNLNSAATPGAYTICSTVGNCAGAGGGVTTPGGTASYIPKFTGAQTLANSEIIDNGTQVLINQATGTYKLDVAGDINSTTGLRVGGNLVCTSTGCSGTSGSGFYIQNGTGLQTAANFNIQSASSAGVVAVLQGASGQTADLLDVQNSAGTIKYLSVSTNGIAVAGNVNATGSYQVNGSQIASSNLSDSANLAKLNGTGPQTFTGNNKFTGTLLNQTATNSTTAFEIQNAAGTSNLLIADTTNSRIGIGVQPAYTLDVAGSVNISTGSSYDINGVAICGPSATCAPSSGSNNYIQNGVGLQTNANFNIQSTATGSVVGIIGGLSGQTADILDLKDGSGNIITSVGNLGQTTFKNSTNSTTAFQVLNATSVSLLNVDTSGSIVTLGGASGEVILGNSTNGSIVAATTGQTTYTGNARHTKYITLRPEYGGAVLSSNVWNSLSDIGTMTAGFDTAQYENYYQWTTSQSTNQAYDVAVSIPIPTDFSAWASSTPITVDVKTSDITNGIVNAKLYDTNKTIETNWNTCSLTPGSANTWTTVTGCSIGGTYSNSGTKYITLIIQMQAPNGGTTELGNINLAYLSSF